MHLRAFIAVEIDHQTKQKISELILQLKKSNADVKWVTKDQIHLTLKFLGNIGQDKIQDISNGLSHIANKTSSFAIHLSKVGAFPNMNHPRVIWIGIDKGAENLKILADKIEAGLEKLRTNLSNSVEIRKESHEFKVHLTLGRVRSSKNMSDLVKLLKEADFSSENNIFIAEFILFQSTLTPKGAIYTPLSKFNLNRRT